MEIRAVFIDDVLYQIFEFSASDGFDLLKLGWVNQQWFNLSRTPRLWKYFVEKEMYFPDAQTEVNPSNRSNSDGPIKEWHCLQFRKRDLMELLGVCNPLRNEIPTFAQLEDIDILLEEARIQLEDKNFLDWFMYRAGNILEKLNDGTGRFKFDVRCFTGVHENRLFNVVRDVDEMNITTFSDLYRRDLFRKMVLPFLADKSRPVDLLGLRLVCCNFNWQICSMESFWWKTLNHEKRRINMETEINKWGADFNWFEKWYEQMQEFGMQKQICHESYEKASKLNSAYMKRPRLLRMILPCVAFALLIASIIVFACSGSLGIQTSSLISTILLSVALPLYLLSAVYSCAFETTFACCIRYNFEKYRRNTLDSKTTPELFLSRYSDPTRVATHSPHLYGDHFFGFRDELRKSFTYFWLFGLLAFFLRLPIGTFVFGFPLFFYLHNLCPTCSTVFIIVCSSILILPVILGLAVFANYRVGKNYSRFGYFNNQSNQISLVCSCCGYIILLFFITLAAIVIVGELVLMFQLDSRTPFSKLFWLHSSPIYFFFILLLMVIACACLCSLWRYLADKIGECLYSYVYGRDCLSDRCTGCIFTTVDYCCHNDGFDELCRGVVIPILATVVPGAILLLCCVIPPFILWTIFFQFGVSFGAATLVFLPAIAILILANCACVLPMEAIHCLIPHSS